jgi:hypothetical protein
MRCMASRRRSRPASLATPAGPRSLAGALGLTLLLCMRLRILTCLLIAGLAGCAADRPAAPRLQPRGALAALLDPVPASLDGCVLSARTYGRPFWRAPYRECRDTLPTGWQFAEFDSDTIVTELARAWTDIGDDSAAMRAFVREAGRLTAAFGPPAECRPLRHRLPVPPCSP